MRYLCLEGTWYLKQELHDLSLGSEYSGLGALFRELDAPEIGRLCEFELARPGKSADLPSLCSQQNASFYLSNPSHLTLWTFGWKLQILGLVFV